MSDLEQELAVARTREAAARSCDSRDGVPASNGVHPRIGSSKDRRIMSSVNLAARLCGEASDGQILLSQRTHSHRWHAAQRSHW